MNNGLFGIAAGSAAASTSKVFLRNPFKPSEANKSGIRLGTNGVHAVQYNPTALGVVLRDIAYSPSLDIAVAIGHGGTTGTPTVATGGVYSSPDGVIWTQRTVTSGVYPSVYWTGTVFIAQANASTAWQSSSNGTTWSVGSPALPANTLIFKTYQGKLYGFAATTTYYEFTNTYANAAPTSRVAPTNYIAPTGVTLACGALVLCSGTSIRYTYDGLNWSVGTSPNLAHITELVGNSTTLIAISSSGTYNISYTAGLTWVFASGQVLNLNSVEGPTGYAPGGAGVAGVAGPVASLVYAMNNCIMSGNIGERIGIILALQFTTKADASTSTSYNSRHLAHTTDGLTWTIEHPHCMADSTISLSDYAGCAMRDRFALLTHNDTAATNYIHITSPNFMELIYAV